MLEVIKPLHQDHQEADRGLLFLDGAVVAVANVFGHRLVESPLLRVRGTPLNRHQLREARLEKRVARRRRSPGAFQCE